MIYPKTPDEVAAAINELNRQSNHKGTPVVFRHGGSDFVVDRACLSLNKGHTQHRIVLMGRPPAPNEGGA